MAVRCIECSNCKNDPLTRDAGAEYCKEDLWDRNDADQVDIHADDDYAEMINKERYCSEYQAV